MPSSWRIVLAAHSCSGEHLQCRRERQPESVRHRATGHLAIVHVKPLAKMCILYQCPRKSLVCQGEDERMCRIVERECGGPRHGSRPTTHAQPVFKVHDVVHYCVANMPGAVPR